VRPSARSASLARVPRPHAAAHACARRAGKSPAVLALFAEVCEAADSKLTASCPMPSERPPLPPCSTPAVGVNFDVCRNGVANCANVVLNAALLAAVLDRPLLVASSAAGARAGKRAEAVDKPGFSALSAPQGGPRVHHVPALPACGRNQTRLLDLHPLFRGNWSQSRGFAALACQSLSERMIIVQAAYNWIVPRLAANVRLPALAQQRAKALFAPGANAFGDAARRELWPGGLTRYVRPPTLPRPLVAIHARHHFGARDANPWVCWGYTTPSELLPTLCLAPASAQFHGGGSEDAPSFHARLLACAARLLATADEERPQRRCGSMRVGWLNSPSPSHSP
jgi:hypothetical protein